ncbi:MAG: chromate resistance protein ChrB domain-containing protein, partial [Planctomycetaceae bacterium]
SHQGHCSFHALLREYDISDPVLQRIARIIDEADTVQEVTVEPTAPGLDLICEGLRLTSPDDATACERGAMIYDALYAKLAREMRLVPK